MINYQNGKVYKIINENNEIVYIGSTAQELLCDRYKTHKYKALNHKIILIENYACNSRQELCMREQQIIEEHSDLLNKIKAYCSEEEKTKEYKKQEAKKYRENNKEHFKQYKKEYRENNKDIINQYNKEYRENNKKYFKKYQTEYSKKYRENNKEELKQKQKVKIKCEYCNCEITKANLKRHQKSKKCLIIQKI